MHSTVGWGVLSSFLKSLPKSHCHNGAIAQIYRAFKKTICRQKINLKACPPKMAQDSPRWPQGPPKRPHQDGPRWLPSPPREGPRWPNMAPSQVRVEDNAMKIGLFGPGALIIIIISIIILTIVMVIIIIIIIIIIITPSVAILAQAILQLGRQRLRADEGTQR